MNDNNMPSHHGPETRSTPTEYPNLTMKLLMERASCRNFSERRIDKQTIDSILEAGIHAPTGGNLQPYSIIKIENKENAKKIAELCGKQDFIADAPLNLLFCIDWHRLQRWAEHEYAPFSATNSFRHFWISLQDTVIAAQNICTAADAMGLGSVYIGTVLECFRELRDMFKLPNGVFPVVLLCVGYPKNKPLIRKKLPVSIIVHDEQYRHIDEDRLAAAFNEKHQNIKVEITDSRLKQIDEVCRKIHGKDFADNCLARIKEQSYINAAQRYFGLHYAADLMSEGNDDFIKIMKESGFNWFEKYEPSGHRGP